MANFTVEPAFTETFSKNLESIMEIDKLSEVVSAASLLLTYRAGAMIYVIWLPVVIIIGYVSSAISLAVTTQANNRRLSSFVYLTGISINDLIGLTVASYGYINTALLKRSLVKGTPFIREKCKVGIWLFQLIQFSTSLIILMMTLDRMIAVVYPLRSRSLCTVTRARVSIILIWVFSAIYVAPVLYTSDIIFTVSKEQINVICAAEMHQDKLIIKMYSFTNIFVMSLLPSVLILILNVIIIHGVRSSDKVLLRENQYAQEMITCISGSNLSARAHEQLMKKRKKQVQNKQITVTLLLVSFTFLLLSLPTRFRLAYYSTIDEFSDAQAYADYVLWHMISRLMSLTNYAVNAGLYSVASRKIRKDIRKLFMCTADENSLTN